MEEQIKFKSFDSKDDARLAVIKTGGSINAICKENNVLICGVIYGVSNDGVNIGNIAMIPSTMENKKTIAMGLIKLATIIMKHQAKGSIFDSITKIFNEKNNTEQNGEWCKNPFKSNTKK